MIDEEKLIDDIEVLPFIHGRYDHKNANIDFISGVETMYEMVMNKIKEQPKISKWIKCSELPEHSNEVLIFNGKSYSVGYYDGKSWVNAIHPVEWQEINHEHRQSDQKLYQ